MRALLQRVDRAAVHVDGAEVARIGSGLLVLIGCVKDDGESKAKRLAERVARYRVFPDDEGKANLDVREARGSVLVVPQFTLAADTQKGNRPSFSTALAPKQSYRLVEIFVHTLRNLDLVVAEGVFGAEMLVDLTNHGPATYLLEVG
ncbi:MAG: D-aminoacyl-tRNA deacylase [Planctomycetes bacterium]|nr:D-aminoacyl-tRNA deacylase [Planctomycetota bacterium]